MGEERHDRCESRSDAVRVVGLDLYNQTVTGGVAMTLTAKANDPHHVPCVLVAYGISPYTSHSMLSSNPHSGIYIADTSRTLDLNGGNPACNQGGVLILVKQTSV